jgi:ABC-type transport system involved in cytochrome bd biosynthesis fused ATPase/permease subunit
VIFAAIFRTPPAPQHALDARERTGTLLSRILHDVQDAAAVIYMGVVVALLDAAQLLIAVILLAGTVGSSCSPASRSSLPAASCLQR